LRFDAAADARAGVEQATIGLGAPEPHGVIGAMRARLRIR
jgi:hypothetical protein